MSAKLRVLIVDDSEIDAELLVRELIRGGYDVSHTRVWTSKDMAVRLASDAWDVVLLDVVLPSFSAMGALSLMKSIGAELPTIIVSGAVGEEMAAALMRAGAHDFISKDRLARLPAAVARELHEAEVRRERKRAQEALRRSQQELALRNRFADVFLSLSGDELYRAMLDIVVEQTTSPLGFFGYVDEDGALVAPATFGRIREQVAEADSYPRFPRDQWRASLWGQALVQGKTLVRNTAQRLPAGHVPVECAAVAPIVYQGTAIGVLVVANKIGGYQAADVATLEQMALLIAPMLQLQLERDAHERRRKTAEEDLRQSLQRLSAATAGIIKAMVQAVEMRDPYTAGHQRRVARLATAIANELGLCRETVDGLHYASVVHDVGKISMPAEILSKPSRLSAVERRLVESHSTLGYQILKDVDFPWPVAEIILQHHERLDGTGYPGGLKGEAIRIEAKILGIADTVDAIASHRPYRPALGVEAAVKELVAGRGVRYDPAAVDACCRLITEKGFRVTDDSQPGSTPACATTQEPAASASGSEGEVSSRTPPADTP